MNIDKIKTQKINNTKKIELKSDYKNHSDIIQNDSRKLNNSLECLQNYNRTNISFQGTTDNSKKISTLRTQAAKNFFSEINSISPKKCEILLNCKPIINLINEDSTSEYFEDKLQCIYSDELKLLKKTILNLSPKEIETGINLYNQRYTDTEWAGMKILKSLVVYSTDKDCHKFMMNSPVVTMDTSCGSGYSKDLCEYLCNLPPSVLCNISLNAANLIYEELQKDNDYGEYTSYSDNVKENEKKSKYLSNILSESINNGDIVAYRGERSSWMFEQIPVDKQMEKEARLIIESNPNSKKELIFPNTKHFSSSPKENIYSYIKSKNQLSLADVMLVCKYADKKFIDNVLTKINSAQVIDNNFKSFTLSKEFAENWATKKHQENKDDKMLSIVSTTNIQKGNQVGYSARSKQYEFILNNNEKLMTFSNAKFNKEKNMFMFDSEIKSI